MTCSRRIYKGEDTEILIPFAVEGYTDLSISFYTDGTSKITIENPEVVDGNIVVDFGEHDLDILPDGVLRYDISYSIVGEEMVISTNTPFVVKTPPSYSAKTAEEYFEEGYESGLTACSGETCNLQEKQVTINADETILTPDTGYDGMSTVTIDAADYGQSKYQDGYDEGWASGNTEGYDDGFDDGWDAGYPSGRTDGVSSGYSAGYTDGYSSGYTQGQADCPECSGSTDCSSAITEAFESGVTSEIGEVSSILIRFNTLHPANAMRPGIDRPVTCNGYNFEHRRGGYEFVTIGAVEYCYPGSFNQKYLAPSVVTIDIQTGLFTTWEVWDVAYVKFNCEDTNHGAGGFVYYASSFSTEVIDEEWSRVTINLQTTPPAQMSAFTLTTSDLYVSSNNSQPNQVAFTNSGGWSSVTIATPLVYSFKLTFDGSQPISKDDISGIYAAGDDFIAEEISITDTNINTLINVYGHPNSLYSSLFEVIRFKIPTSVYQQWTQCNVSNVVINGFYNSSQGSSQMYGGIRFAPYRTTAIQNSDNTTSIFVTLYNNN